MSDISGSDWKAVEDETLAELEAEQAKYAAELEELRSAERTSAGLGSSTPNLLAENEQLRAELAAMASVSASASKRRDEEDVKAKLAQLSAENAKLTAALKNGVGLSDLTGVRPSASVLAASRARMAALVSLCAVQALLLLLLAYTYSLHRIGRRAQHAQWQFEHDTKLRIISDTM